MTEWREVDNPDDLVMLPATVATEDEFALPPYGVITSCPKCGYDKVRTEYHAVGYLDGPCGKRYKWPRVAGIGEHLCRTCGMCGFGWPEAVNAGV